jgi:hypothetical protein
MIFSKKKYNLYLSIFIIILLLTLLYIFNLFFVGKEGLTTQSGGAITNVSPTRSDQPLCQYSIKSSYDSAYDGSSVSTGQIKKVLQTGCRFIDLEIFSISGVPSVGYSVDPTFTNLTSKNHILLTDAFTIIISNCFSSSTCTNSGDPLFIQLRIKSKDTNNIYKEVASAIDSVFSNTEKLYLESDKKPKKIDNNTLLNEINGKIIFIIDKTISPDYANYTTCYGDNSQKTCYDLTDYINMESGGNTLQLLNYSSIFNQQTNPPVIMDDFKTTNSKVIKMAIPDPLVKTKNPDYRPFLKNYGIQNVAYMFWQNDKNLADYEAGFAEYKSAFVPFAYFLHSTTST